MEHIYNMFNNHDNDFIDYASILSEIDTYCKFPKNTPIEGAGSTTIRDFRSSYSDDNKEVSFVSNMKWNPTNDNLFFNSGFSIISELMEKNFNYLAWKNINFNEPSKLKEFVYSFNFYDNINNLQSIMQKDNILRKDSELINYLYYYFIRLIEEKKFIGLADLNINPKIEYFNDEILNINNETNNLKFIIFNTGLITYENKYIYSINSYIKKILPPPGLVNNIVDYNQNIKKWKCIKFIDETELDDFIQKLDNNYKNIPKLEDYKKHIDVANFLPLFKENQELMWINPIKIIKDINSTKNNLNELCKKFIKNYNYYNDNTIPSNTMKCTNDLLASRVLKELEVSIKKYSRNNRIILHQYYFDSSESKGTIQLLIPICLNLNYKKWTPHCVVAIKYYNNTYEIVTLLCLKFARLNARLISELEYGLLTKYHSYDRESYSSIRSDDEMSVNVKNYKKNNIKNYNDDLSIKTINKNINKEKIGKIEKIEDIDDKYNYKFCRPCKHYFGLSGYKISSCKNGNNCNFSHDIDNVKTCKMWLSSKSCKNGDKCDFLHGIICDGKIIKNNN